MSTSNDNNDAFGEAFKERLRALPFLALLFAIIFAINKGLWGLDKISVMWLIVALVPIKLFVIVLRSWQLWVREGKEIIFLLLFILFLFSAFIFDFETVPKLLAYGLGRETQGKVVEFIVTTKSHFVVYEFSANNVVFRKQQVVSISYFEALKPGSTVLINYLPNNPRVAFLADLDHLKFETMLSIFLGFGIISSLYAAEIKEKVATIINSSLKFRKPA